jgi:hypothetical protein
VDEELGFKVINFSNVKLIFLPANSTNVIQPLDQGIIAAVKAHYRRLLVHWLLTEAGAAEKKDKSLRELKPTFYQMMQWVQQAWTQCIAPSVISNCWYKAGILPDGWVAPAGTGAQRTAMAQLQLATIATAPTQQLQLLLPLMLQLIPPVRIAAQALWQLQCKAAVQRLTDNMNVQTRQMMPLHSLMLHLLSCPKLQLAQRC